MDITSSIAQAAALQSLQFGQQTALLAIQQNVEQEKLVLQSLDTAAPVQAAPPPGVGQLLDIIA